MRRSLGRTLLVGHALILLVVLGGFAAALITWRQADAAHQVDAELATLALAVHNAIEWEEADGFEVEFRQRLEARFHGTGRDATYLIVMRPDTSDLLRTPGAPSTDVPATNGDRSIGTRREHITNGPAGTRILVGRDTAALAERLRRFAWLVVGVAALAFLAALAGGVLLVRRLLAPLGRISETAARLSASNRTERIDLGRTEVELQTLAGTLNAAFDRLDDAVTRQARFTADASHELRTPLAVLRTHAEWARRGDRSRDDLLEALTTVERAAARMGTTVADLLTLARDDAGEGTPDAAVLDLRSLAADVTAFLEPLATARQIEVAVEGPEVRVRGDAERLHRALTNLVANAIEHNGPGGHVEVETAFDGRQVLLSVQDDGPGIPADAEPHVFERFFRADPSRTRSTGGSGLGLAISRETIEAHGGTLTVASGPSGTTFTIRLPGVGSGA